MTFRERLERICARVDGALGAVIIAEDGIVVERHVVDPSLDVEMASVEFVGAAREIRRATAAIDAGELEELIVTNSGRITVLRLVGPGYYLLLHLAPTALVGRGRYELRRAAHELAGEFV
jgi:predicted regulator of Ras-like GTPase activity (Roadblock/LC7/MglB family)